MKAELLAGVGKPDGISAAPVEDVDPFANISPPRGGARSAEEKRREAEEEKRMEAEAKALVKQREEALRQAAAEKNAAAKEIDSVFADDGGAAKSKKSKGAKGELSGWRLKKELRKAQSEADEKDIPYAKCDMTPIHHVVLHIIHAL